MRLQVAIVKHILANLILSQMLVVSSAIAAPACKNLFNQSFGYTRYELPSQHLENNMFNVRRRLWNYSDIFESSQNLKLESVIQGLPNQSVWIDMGAGEANAIYEGMKLNPNINGVALSYKKPSQIAHLEEFGNRVKYIDGDIVENMYQSGHLNHYKNKTALITDVYGPMSYSKRMDIVFDVYMQLLKKDGELYFNLMDEAIYQVHKSRPNQLIQYNKIETQKGQIDFIEWIRSIPGIQIMQLKEKRVGNIENNAEVSTSYKIIKKVEHVYVPHNIELLSVDDSSSPPIRTYKLKEN